MIYNGFAFIGQMGSGKTEACKYITKLLGNLFNIEKVSFADEIKYLSKKYFNIHNKSDTTQEGFTGREVYQKIGMGFREIDRDVWCNMTEQIINNISQNDYCSLILIDDLRLENEVKTVRRNDLLIIGIEADEELRVDRIQKRDGILPTKKQLNHKSEIEAKKLIKENNYDYLINNNGSIEEFYKKIQEIMKGVL
jgi:dephospho-CoA kinase